MTENNTAQILDAIRAAGYRDHPTNIERKRVDAILLAVEPLLSKLRAEGVRAGELPAYIIDDSHPLQYRLGWNNCLSDCRAALASAPVAGEPRGRQGVSVERLAKDPFLAAQLWRNPVDRAPVAGEAQPLGYVAEWCSTNKHDGRISVCSRSRITTKHQAELTAKQWADQSPKWGPMRVTAVYAAPQASPVAGEAQRPVGYRPPSSWRNAMTGFITAEDFGGDVERLEAWAKETGAVPLYAAPQASEAVRLDDVKAIAREVAVDSKAIRAEARNAALEEAAANCEEHAGMRSTGAWVALTAAADRIRALKTQADKDGGDCAKGGHVETANQPETRADIGFGGGLLDCAKGAGDDAGITASGDERAALEMLIREAQAVADDYHNPRYTRLDEAIQSARAALSPTPSVVKQSLTATQTGEKGESDAG